jgi:protein phosphatase inhibitor 2
MSTTEEIATASSGTASPKPATTVAVKPALKHSDDDEDVEMKHSPSNNHSPRKKHGKKKKGVHLKWDEAKIKEHDQLRGTRMKIEEPNTPYNHYYDSGSETDGSMSSAKHNRKRGENDSSTQISWDALTNKLEAHAAAKEAYPSSPSSRGAEEEEDDEDREKGREKELKKLEFKEHRKRHYNEMELVRKFRQEHPDEDVEADDENDADDENE